MMEIRLGEILTGVAAAVRGQWSKILGIFSIRKFDVSLGRERFAVPSQSRRQHTIEHIKSLFNGMSDVFRSSDAHQISRFIGR